MLLVFKNEWEEILENAKAKKSSLIVYFYTPWCEHCKIMDPHYEELASEHINTIIAVKCDIDECEDVAAKYGVAATPTFFKFVYNQETRKWERLMTHGAEISELREMFP